MTQATLSRVELQHYSSYSAQLIADIAQVKEDLQFEADGGDLWYAVDFSEVFGFLVPSDPDESWLWPHLDEASQHAVEHCALGELLLPATSREATGPRVSRPILLAPYAIEFQNFLAQLRSGLHKDLMTRVPSYITDVEELRNMPEARALMQLASEVEESGRTLTAEEIGNATAFFEENAASLVALVRGGQLNPLKRAEIFLGKQPFEPLEKVVSDVHITGDEQTVKDRFVRLCALRRKHDGASYIDALGLEYVLRANRRLQGEHRRKRIVFVTRSSFIEQLMASPEERNAWTFGFTILRHPRCFVPRAWHSNSTLAVAIAELTSTAASLALFHQSAELRLKSQWKELLGTRKQDAPLIEMVADLKDRILRLAKIGSALNESDLATIESQRKRHESSALQLLAMLRNRGELFAAIAGRMAEINGQIDRNHEVLGVFLQSHDALAAERIKHELLLARSSTGRPALTHKFGEVAYPIHFESETLRKWATRMNGPYDLDRGDVWEFLATTTHDNVDHYEVLLFMAYVVATVQQWSLAEDYCRRALLSAEHHGRGDSPEARFFQAYCKRRGANSPQQLIEAHEILNQLLQRHQDVRVAAEMGALRLIWHARARQDKDWKAGAPALDDGIDMLTRALTLATSVDDRTLRVHILNNLCYAFIYKVELEAENMDLRKKANQVLEQLDTALREIEVDSERWPLHFVHTVAWANYLLAPEWYEPDQLDKLLRALERDLPSERMPIDRNVMSGHLKLLKTQHPLLKSRRRAARSD